MGKVQNENFFTVQGWMINELGLKGNELMVYAIIYGFSQTEEQYFTGSWQYLMDWTNASRKSIYNILTSLVEKGLLEKKDKVINKVTYCEYKALRPATGSEENTPGVVQNLHGGSVKITPGVVQNLHGGDVKNTPGVVQNLHGGSVKITPNNIENNIKNNIENNIKDKIEDKVKQIYNDTCVSFPKIVILSEARKKIINNRLKNYSIEELEAVFKKAEASSFLKGNNNRNWNANFDWLMKDSNIVKVLEGNYDDKPGGSSMGTKNKTAEKLDESYEMLARWADSDN